MKKRTTEQSSKYNALEKMSVKELLININKEDKTVPHAIEKVIPKIEKLVAVIVKKMQAGGRLFYMGAGTDVPDGPPVSATYPLGYFREDYEFISHPGQTDYLDEHNGRFCVTPEYPNGIYCYFATVDANWNSAYPYVVGPTFYGVKTAVKVTSITEPVTVYSPTASGLNQSVKNQIDVSIFPVPANDIVAIQYNGLALENINIFLYDINGKLIDSAVLYQGSTIVYFDTKKLYSGDYFVSVVNGSQITNKKISIVK